MDVYLRFEERALRTISLRQLSRRTSAILDEILENGAALLISRYGQPIAVLSPIEAAEIDREAARRTRDREAQEVEQALPDLDPTQRAVLERVVAIFPFPWSANDPWVTRERLREILIAMSRLQDVDLIEQVPMGVRATKLGKRIWEKLAEHSSAS